MSCSKMRNSHQQVLQLLGLAKRAGQLTSGEPSVVKAIRNDEARLVVLASDAGAATAKKVTDKCRYYQVTITTAFTANEISIAVGASRKVLAVTQAVFAKKMTSLLNN